jgi:CRP/FNR family transcriptional regulator
MLEQVPIFASLPEEHLRRLEAISRQIFTEKGSILFSPGDVTQGFYAVLDGAVRVYRVSLKGKEISLEIVGAGSVLAGASLFSDIYHCYAEALKESTVCLVRKEPFLQMIQTDIRFAAEWIRVLSLEVMHLHQRLGELTLKSPKERIASYILLLCEMENADSATLPVHRKSIATLLGMTHETFYRTAKELEDEGMVRFDGQGIKIVNRSVLEELME